MFGEGEAIGKPIELVLQDGQKLLITIAGVLDVLPQNTSFMFDFMIPFENYIDIHALNKHDWSVWVDGTFIQKNEAMQTKDIVSLLDKYLPYQNEVNPEQQVSAYHVGDILEWSSYESSLYKSGFRGDLHPASVAGTISSAVAVLLLALFNFINTSLAISRKRLKEIGVRKVIGGGRLDLKIQFLLENFLQVLIALFLSGIITYYLSDAYNSMFPFDIVEFSRISMVPFLTFMFVVWFFAGLMSGIYPAFYISKFKPVEILKSKIKFSRKNLFTKSLITIQFAVCIYNVFALIVFVQNTKYQDELDRGYEVNRSINIPLTETSQFKVLKAALEPEREIEEVTGTANPIGFGVNEIAVRYLTDDIDVSSISAGLSYLESLNVKLAQGRFFEVQGGNEDNIIINEMLSNQLGGDALNDWIYYEDKRYRVVGVVKDFNLKPIMLTNKIRPTVIFYSPESDYKYANVRISNSDIYQADKTIQQVWQKLYPDEMYLSFMQSDVLRAVNETNTIMISINLFVAVVIILITALGLYAQVSLNTQSRIKEFGVRKVLGAPIYNILYLINKEIVIMLLVASVIGLIGGNIAINAVMDIVYAYHKEIETLNFVWPVIVIFGIMSLAIGQIVLRAAKTNPVEQLRTE